MTDLLAARAQMAMSLGFHIVFAAIAINPAPTVDASSPVEGVAAGEAAGVK